jgi:NAD(P)-dependent dehydrogenase (short-subunit alcohol dehydrogenase family)
MGRLAGRRALITGAGSGIGRAAVARFAQEGATVVGCDLDRTAEVVAEELNAAGFRTQGQTTDLAEPAEVAIMVERAVEFLGGIDIVWNNAGANRPGSIEQTSLEDWDFVLRNELTLVYTVVKQVWPHLKVQGGSIVNTASVAASMGNGIFPQAPHHAAKAGVVGLTRQIAMEGAQWGIRSNSVSPAHIRTPQTAALTTGAHRRDVVRRYPLGRLGTVDDVVNAGLFLASDESSWITGVDLVVDGGRTAGVAPG